MPLASLPRGGTATTTCECVLATAEVVPQEPEIQSLGLGEESLYDQGMRSLNGEIIESRRAGSGAGRAFEQDGECVKAAKSADHKCHGIAPKSANNNTTTNTSPIPPEG